MRICLISTSDLAHGAAIAAFQLHRALRQAGHQSTLLVSVKHSDDPDVVEINPEPKGGAGYLARKLDVRFEQVLNLLGPQNQYSIAARGLLAHPALLQADVVHVHNLHWPRFNLSTRILPHLTALKPTAWTFHDMWPITGHCIYTMDCERWLTGCGHCPALDRHMSLARDSSAWLMRIKQRTYAKSHFTVVAPSRWLQELAVRSPILKGRVVEQIPNVIDPELMPIDSTAARSALGLPVDRPVVLFASNVLSNPFKGADWFAKAIPAVLARHPRTCILTFGDGHPPASITSILPVINLGRLANPRLKSLAYSASDVLVHPSLADNLPNMVLEALSCGTPTTAFSIGGLTEMIRDGITGRLADAGQAPGLGRGIADVLDRPLEFRSACLEDFQQRFACERTVEMHLALYRRLLAAHETSVP